MKCGFDSVPSLIGLRLIRSHDCKICIPTVLVLKLLVFQFVLYTAVLIPQMKRSLSVLNKTAITAKF